MSRDKSEVSLFDPSVFRHDRDESSAVNSLHIV
jgi:hypothetical protein